MFPFVSMGPCASLALKFFSPLDLGGVSLPQKAFADFHLGLFYFLQASAKSYLVHRQTSRAFTCSNPKVGMISSIFQIKELKQ